MNNATRKEIREIITGLERLQSVVQDADYEDMTYLGRLEQLVSIEDDLDTIRDQISTFASDEQDKYDNLSESLQGGERGEAIQAAAEALESCDSEIDDVQREIDDVTAEIKSYKGKGLEGMTLDDITDKAQEISDTIQDVIDYLEEAIQ